MFVCEGKCGSLVLAFLIFLLEILARSSWKYNNFFFFSQGCYFALSKFTIRSKPGRYYCVLPGNKCNNPVFTFTISLISKDVFCYSVNMFCYFTDSISYSKAYFFFFQRHSDVLYCPNTFFLSMTQRMCFELKTWL